MKLLWEHLRQFSPLSFIKEILYFFRFFLLVGIVLFADIFIILSHLPGIRIIANPLRKPASRIMRLLIRPFNANPDGEISSLDLITLSIRHLKAKKVRTTITIGGMALGFGSIIFLLSLGYGAQRLVVSRVARLEEMRQINVTVGQAAALRLNDKTMEEFINIDTMEKVLPVISVVGKVQYNNSVSDIIAYGVTSSYLTESAILPSKGKVFESEEYVAQLAQVPNSSTSGQVAGAQVETLPGAAMGKKRFDIRFSIHPQIWTPVYSQPSSKSPLLGYTKRDQGNQQGTEVWGAPYSQLLNAEVGSDYFGNLFQPWVKGSFLLWKQEQCLPENPDCVEGKYVVDRENGPQHIVDAYITTEQVSLRRFSVIDESQQIAMEGDKINDVSFSLEPKTYIQVYSQPNQDSPLINLFTHTASAQVINGELLYGQPYPDEQGFGRYGLTDNQQPLGAWVRTKVPLWRKLDCSDCQNLYLTETDENEKQIVSTIYLPASQVLLAQSQLIPTGKVLGEATESAELAASPSPLNASGSSDLEDTISTLPDEPGQNVELPNGDVIMSTQAEDGSIEWVRLASESAAISTAKTPPIPLGLEAKRVALANRAMLKVLGLSEEEAVGKKFTVSFLLSNELFESGTSATESETSEFEIIGIIPEDKTPAFYLPFNDLKSLGINHYDQVKAVVKEQDHVKGVRQAIESMGFKTSSVVDTVGKINDLFGTVRLVLMILGLVALGVAALGMFNTLTVSLLEKTREVGLMKAIGMKSHEVKRLFLAESIIMGLSGGFFGLVVGFTAGQIVSALLSVMAISKGLGYIALVHIPISLAIGVIALSFIIGVATGLYPAIRATKISALNALRYE